MLKVMVFMASLVMLAGNAVLAADASSGAHATRLQAALDAQSSEAKARYKYRHPRETLEFFGITPGMTVVELLPGGGWYSKILLDYLGEDGQLIGVDYNPLMFTKFGLADDDLEKLLKSKETWAADWTAKAKSWGDSQSAEVSAFALGSLPQQMVGKADAALIIRALHGMARFENNGGYLTAALEDVYRSLKPGGIVGIVQHHARDNMSNEWASGKNGYLKKGVLIDAMEQVGFEFVAESDLNSNPKDQPSETDIVWRLPPSLNTSKDDAELQEKFKAIGESNRMTLKFRKPK